MNSSDAPKKQPVPFGVNGSREDLPPTTPSGDNTASYDAGFPPITMILKAAGGLPPKGQDMNQILYELSNLARWNSAGAMNAYDAAFSTAISGYPKGAILANSSFSSTWLNTTEANTASPESSTTSGWVPSKNYGVTAITGLAATNVTLTALQASNDRITLAGTLTANINLVFPSWLSKWIVTNNCTGNFTVTCKTSSGSGVAVPIGTTAVVFSDGTNITLNGPVMVQAATNNNHAVNLGQGNAQWSPVVGSSRNAKMSVTAASATATFTADQLTVTTGLSGQPYLLTSFSKTINLATTGAGGMDTGTVPASGFVALYAIYNPITLVSALLAVNATSVVAPEVYGGANMPAGYTASALVGVLPVASSQFPILALQGRSVSIESITAMSGTTGVGSVTPQVVNAIPLNAVSAYLAVTTGLPTVNTTGVMMIASSSGLIGACRFAVGVAGGGTVSNSSNSNIAILFNSRTFYWQITSASLSYVVTVGRYEF